MNATAVTSLLLTAVMLFQHGTLTAQTITHRTGSGSSVKVDLGNNNILNRNSSLVWQWVLVDDSAAPVEFLPTPSFGVAYRQGYVYFANVQLKTKQDVAAVEVIHIIQDAFGRRSHTLQHVDVADTKAGNTLSMSGEWRILFDADAQMALGSTSYVRSVRLANGAVYHAPQPQIRDAIRRTLPTVTDQDLEPSRPPKNTPQ